MKTTDILEVLSKLNELDSRLHRLPFKDVYKALKDNESAVIFSLDKLSCDVVTKENSIDIVINNSNIHIEFGIFKNTPVVTMFIL